MGEISKVLFNLVLIDIFDRELPKRFPGIAFCRFLYLIFIASKGNDEVLFDEKDMRSWMMSVWQERSSQ